MYFPLPFGPFVFLFAGAAAQIEISKHPDLLQLAAILLMVFQNVIRPGLQHNSASELWVTFCHLEEHPLVALLFARGTFVSHGHISAAAIVLCGVEPV